MAQRYTRREVGRILGLDASRLRYWERLRLIHPRARWGEMFYSFGDMVAVRAIQRITQNRVPARRIRRAVSILEEQFGAAPLALQELRVFEQGREVVMVPPGESNAFNPIRQQWVFHFESPASAPKVHPMVMRSAQDLFESALRCESSPELLPQAVENYRRAVELAPNWVEAHINLGVAYYQMGQLTEARAAFLSSVQLDPLNGISRYNLGCVLEEQGEIDAAIEHLERAARAMPAHPDVHFNLALAHEKRGDRAQARQHWELYLRYAPNGEWAPQARARLQEYAAPHAPAPPIPFPRKSRRAVRRRSSHD